MRRSTKSELQMLREVGWFLLTQMRCCFCFKPLVHTRSGMTFGHRRHPPISARITIHHRDHNRENNDNFNLGLCHSGCHKKYHAEVNRERRQSDDKVSGS